jgi:hypothetical protein
MKKFVIVMISLLVLFVFLMLNYLVWDKENLLKQRDTDKIAQDWLRGQNTTLQNTVDEQEQTIKTLQDKNSIQENQITGLELQVRLALQREGKNQEDLLNKNDAISLYKLLMEPTLKDVFIQWVSDISKEKLEDSYGFIGADTTLWGKMFTKDLYIQYVSSLKSIELVPDTKDGPKAFSVVTDQENELEIKAQAIVNVSIKESQQEQFTNLSNGNNTIEVIFRYSKESSKWVISSVTTLDTGKP